MRYKRNAILAIARIGVVIGGLALLPGIAPTQTPDPQAFTYYCTGEVDGTIFDVPVSDGTDCATYHPSPDYVVTYGIYPRPAR